MLALRSSVLLHGWTVKMTARVRYLRSTTETERKPAQGADDVLKLLQPTLCLDSRQLTASLSLYSDNASSVYTEQLNSEYFRNNLNAGVQVGNNAKRMRFQIKGLDNVKLGEHARFCMESINVPILYDNVDDRKSLG